MSSELKINTVQLMRQPGLTESVSVLAQADDLDIDDERLAGPVTAELLATSSIDAVRLSGVIDVPWSTECRRCARRVEGVSTAEVDELYQLTLTDEDAYPIDGDFIEITPVVRQYALLELPDGALCRQGCAGLCPDCGVDLNEEQCDCEDDARDPRWAALDGLRLSDDDK